MLTPKQKDSSYYVYQLVDPRDGAVFYVGKGKGRRIKCHCSAVRNGREQNGMKGERIAEIWRAGYEVVERIVKAGLTEEAAFAAERQMIRELAPSGVLTNVVGGSVSSAQSYVARGRELLRATKTYDEWMATAPRSTLASVERLFGSTRKFYDWYVSRIVEEIRQPTPSTLEVT